MTRGRVRACVRARACVCVYREGEGTLIFSCHIGSVPASTVLPKINQVYRACPYTILEILAYPLKYPHSVL